MPDRVRYHLDEHVPSAVARALDLYGIDVITTVEAGLRTCDDLRHLEYAWRSGRVLVTQDADFLRLSTRVPHHAGIAYCPMESRSIGEIIRSLILIYEVLAPEDLVGRVEFL